ncbi:ARM repeat-containing protein [Sistotremastrum suecicum HHB10207 ss-3]|uniref:Nucleolar protein 9 n=1 Tax=Sistotremastrum suecicum HHB10207 ss-3 TaxID=1314776 RepID=A0A166FY99_9AGAM|nr:ARM repeat-containing protein [Sistotremastrum suecicum HHB10207 ss-3]
MPREVRKRGKKKKNVAVEPEPEVVQPEAGPSWIRPAENVEEEPDTLESPFGLVDADLKAYFKNVDSKTREWQENATVVDEGVDAEQVSEEKRMFFDAALSEMRGKERQLACDPESSIILERMLHSMDDFTLRVFMDSLTGSYHQLLKHRFASHVCQTLFDVSSRTVSRETNGIFPPAAEDAEEGELLTMTQLVLDCVKEILSEFAALILDPFASHVLRSLLVLLCPSLSSEAGASSRIRSKKSAAWKSHQGQMSSLFDSDSSKQTTKRSIPKSFEETARNILHAVRNKLDANETRGLAGNNVASPVLQMLLQLETLFHEEENADSLLDRVFEGLVAQSKTDNADITPGDFITTLLRDPNASHLMEMAVSHCPPRVFDLLWSTYFVNNLPRLALHPVSNFIVAKAIMKTDESRFLALFGEMETAWSKSIKAGRTGVLKSVVDKSAQSHWHGDKVIEALRLAFSLEGDIEPTAALYCMLYLCTPKDVEQKRLSAQPSNSHAPQNKHSRQDNAQTGPTTQGALLLQSILRLDEPHHQLISSSILGLSPQDLITVCQNVTSSRVIDVFFESASIPRAMKRTLVLNLIGHYHELVDDRIGSRIGDRCWAFADPFLREKIAKSLIDHEQFLAASFYGKFFARSLNLQLYQRRPGEWKAQQAKSKAQNNSVTVPQSAAQASKPVVSEAKSTKTKRPRDEKHDEIDQVFDEIIGKKRKTGGRTSSLSESKEKLDLDQSVDKHNLQNVLGAIKKVPKNLSGSKHR